MLYRGYNPNNWLWLDENGDGKKVDSELYRIISYEADGTIKVIRNDMISVISWDAGSNSNYVLPWNSTTVSLKNRFYDKNNTANSYCTSYYGCNVWGNQSNTYIDDSTLDAELEEFKYKYYKDNKPETTLSDLNGGTVEEEASLNIILNSHWINSLDRNMQDLITLHPFYVGGIYPNEKSTDKKIQFERELAEQNTYTWTGKVALKNITDMVESSLNPSCTSVWANTYWNNDNADLITNNNWPCKKTNGNWLDKNDWSLSPYSYGCGNVWGVNPAGSFVNYNASNDAGVRPSFFLKSDISLTGEGTKDKPFEIP